MSSLHALQNFIAAVDRSFLPSAAKKALTAEAERGVDQALWGRFNDQLITWLVENQSRQDQANKRLDEEIGRYTALYEQEKTRLDREYRPALEEAIRRGEPADSGVWVEYRRQVGALQSRMVKDVRGTSSTVLREVVLATIGIEE